MRDHKSLRTTELMCQTHILIYIKTTFSYHGTTTLFFPKGQVAKVLETVLTHTPMQTGKNIGEQLICEAATSDCFTYKHQNKASVQYVAACITLSMGMGKCVCAFGRDGL